MQANRERSVADRIIKEPGLEGKIGQVLVPMETTFYIEFLNKNENRIDKLNKILDVSE